MRSSLWKGLSISVPTMRNVTSRPVSSGSAISSPTPAFNIHMAVFCSTTTGTAPDGDAL